MLLTSLGITALMLYYLILYIPENEARINARNFRVLRRVSINLAMSIENYTNKVAMGYGKQLLDDLHKQDPSLRQAGGGKLSPDEVNKKLEEQVLNGRNEARNNGLSYCFEHGKNQTAAHLGQEQNGYLHFASVINYDNQELSKKKFNFKLPFTFNSRIRTDSLLNPLMRWESFSYFVVVQITETAGKPQAATIYNGARSPDNKNLIVLLPPDSLLARARKSDGKNPQEVALAGESFKLYLLNKQISPQHRWILCAAVPAGRFETERRAIPAHIVTFCSLAFAFLLFSLPFLKILLIGNKERLNKSDVVFAGLSVFAGVAMLVLLLFDGYLYYVGDAKTEERRLEDLQTDIAHNLTTEITGVLQQIDTIDTFADTGYSEKLEKQLDTLFKARPPAARGERSYLSHVVRIFWLNASGNMIFIWSPNSIAERKYNVSNRSYFRNVKQQGQGWTLADSPRRFAVESVSSIIDGRKYAVISSQSDSLKTKARVVAMTTKLASLYNPVLPPGYGFCLVDQAGTVLFHQQENLNLNENLLEETNYPSALKAALYSRVSTHLETSYQGNKQRMYIAPVNNLPLFLVTYVNDDFQKVANLHLIMVTVLTLTLYFTILGIFLVLSVYVRSRPAHLHLFWFAFRWLWPNKTYGSLYLKVSMMLAATIILVLCMADPDRPVSTFFMLLYGATYNFIFCYACLHAISIRNIFHSRLYYFSISSVATIVMLNVCSLMTATASFLIGLTFQALLLGIWAIIFRRYITSFPPVSPGYHYRREYNLMLLCWLLLTSALPAFIFFRIAYNYEKELTLRYDQLYLAQKLSQQPVEKVRPAHYPLQVKQTLWYGPLVLKQAAIVPANYVYVEFLQHTRQSIQESTGEKQPSDNISPSGIPFPSAALSGRPGTFFGLKGVLLMAGFTAKTLQAPYQWVTQKLDAVLQAAKKAEGRQANAFAMLVRPKFKNVLADAFFLKANCPPGTDCYPNNWQVENGTLTFTYNQELFPQRQVVLASRLPSYRLPGLRKAGTGNGSGIYYPGLIFWIDLVILVLFIYFLISFLVRRIFSLGLHWNTPLSKLDEQFLNPAEKNKLLVIALPVAPGIKQLLREQRAAGKNSCRIVQIDLAKADFTAPIQPFLPVTFTLPVVVLIQNFAIDPYSEVALKYKVNLLRELNTLRNQKIIIQSSLHPSCWQEKLAATEKDKAILGPASASYMAVLEQLLVHLGAYVKLYQPLHTGVPAEPAHDKYQLGLVAYHNRLIEQECPSWSHLHQFKDALVNYVAECRESNKKVTKADIIFLLQERAQLYYRFIWISCSEEEQYFLYDLAQDGLVNARNKQVLSALLGKGLIVQDGDTSLKIMNDSFQNFVLNVVDPEQALRYEKENAQASAWESYRLPLMLILISGGLFIFFTQKQTWVNIAAVLTVVSTIVGVLPRLGALIPAIFASKEAKTGL